MSDFKSIPISILDGIVELVAIKLYEHDHQGKWPPVAVTSWLALADEDRETYRQLARGVALK